MSIHTTGPSATTSPVVTEFPAITYDQFEQDVALLLERDRLSDDPAGVAGLLRVLIDRDSITSPDARSVLAKSGIRARWNQVFARDRAERLAHWLRPWLLGGEVVDLLAGDCLLTGRMAEVAQAPITAAERFDHYDEFAVHPLVRLVDFDRVESGALTIHAEIAVLVAVLHHEDAPAKLRDVALATGARRFVVVENCVDDHNGPDFHLLMDLFFNRCLNDFGSSCTREHRSLNEWQELLSPFGAMVHLDELRHVPGLPFPYQLMVFER